RRRSRLPSRQRRPFVRQVADRTAAAVGWGVGIGVYGAMIAASADAFIEAIGQMPGIDQMMARIYPDLDIRQPSGLLQLAFFGFGSLLIGFAAATAIGGLTSEENERRLDLVLSHPVARVRWFVTSACGSFTAIALAGLVAGSMIVVAVAGAGGDVPGPVAGTVVLVLYGAAFVGIGLAVAGLGWPRQAAVVTGSVAVASYLLSVLGNALQLPDWLVDLSLLEHVGQPMAGQFDALGMAAMAVLALGGLALGAWGFERRDVAT
ncbi:MAG TPA: hypothetical protein VM344_10770, partial [Vitreimonas sp.]|nr:hypothetical protein [Vitreimonas sp.]